MEVFILDDMNLKCCLKIVCFIALQFPALLAEWHYAPKTRELHIGGIFPLSGGWAGGQGCLPAAMMAQAAVNSRPDLLPGYWLNITVMDSECKPGLGLNRMYDLLYNQPVKTMLLTGCSGVSTFVAQAAPMWNLVVLAYGSSSPALSNRKRFPTFFRTHPSATLHNPTRIKLFQKFKWEKIATIQQSEEVFLTTVKDLEERARKADIKIVVKQDFMSNAATAVKNLKRHDPRIIVGVFYEDMARKVFCEVYKQKLYGKKYVWFLIGWYADNWYSKPDKSINCTAAQMKEALEGHFTTEAMMLNQENVVTDAGITSSTFEKNLKAHLWKEYKKHPNDIEGFPEAPLSYDAVWAMAFALNKTVTSLAAKNRSLHDFTYADSEIRDHMVSAMNNTDFLGVSGKVSFNSDGDRVAWTQIEQMTDGNYSKVGFYDFGADNLSWFNIEKWPGGHPPQDSTREVPMLRIIGVGTYVAMCVLASLGIVGGVACLAFNFKHRKRRIIRHSHPEVNNITVLGCIICLSCVYLQGLDGRFVPEETYKHLCRARVWILSLGFMLGYGSMFSKISAVHRWTTKGKKETEKIKEWEFYLVLFIIMALDIAALLAWHTQDPLERQLENFPFELPDNPDEDVKILPQLEHCSSDHLPIWIGVVFGYKGLLLLFGLLLAYETRSIKIKQVNDNRFVGMSIYNVVILSFITGPVTLVIKSQHEASFVFVSLALILSTFLSMGLIFVPKVIDVIRNPKESVENMALTDSTLTKEEEERYQQLTADNEKLKKEIQEKEERVQQLHRQIQERASQARKRIPFSVGDNSPSIRSQRDFPVAKRSSIASQALEEHIMEDQQSREGTNRKLPMRNKAEAAHNNDVGRQTEMSLPKSNGNTLTTEAIVTAPGLNKLSSEEDNSAICVDQNSDSAIVLDVTPVCKSKKETNIHDCIEALEKVENGLKSHLEGKTESSQTC